MRMLCQGAPRALFASASIAPRTSAIRPALNETSDATPLLLQPQHSRLICNPMFPYGETIFDAEPGAIAVPVLVVSNE